MESINPYAPTIQTSAAPIRPIVAQSKVTSLSVAMRTIGGIALAGGVFGIGLVLVMWISSRNFGAGAFVLIAIAFVYGTILASIASIFTVSVLMVPFQALVGLWTVKQIRCFAIIAGAISGFVSLAVPMGFASEAILWALVPAVVGAIGAVLMVRPCIKLVIQERNDALLAVGDENPLVASDLDPAKIGPPVL